MAAEDLLRPAGRLGILEIFDEACEEALRGCRITRRLQRHPVRLGLVAS
jgi:hypothetical protein